MKLTPIYRAATTIIWFFIGHVTGVSGDKTLYFINVWILFLVFLMPALIEFYYAE
jgi:hypothetical protein